MKYNRFIVLILSISLLLGMTSVSFAAGPPLPGEDPGTEIDPGDDPIDPPDEPDEPDEPQVPERSSDGAAYAILRDNGDLILFRSSESYENDTAGAFTDILGNTYEGIVFSDVESEYKVDGVNRGRWYGYRSDLKTVSVAGGQKITPADCSQWFSNSSLVSGNLEGLDTSGVTKMTEMFSYCRSLTSIDVSGLDTSNVTDMRSMFDNCSLLTNLDLSNWDTANVTDARTMFQDCTALESLNVSGWNTEHIEDMHHMFNECQALKSLDLSSWNTQGVANMGSAFLNCSSLSQVSLGPNFNFRGDKESNHDAMLPGSKWIRTDKTLPAKTVATLRDDYVPEWAGTWVLSSLVTFDPKGGTVEPAAADMIVGENYILPTPTIANGLVFDCWTDRAGNMVTEDMTVTNSDIVLYAKWKLPEKTYAANYGGRHKVSNNRSLTGGQHTFTLTAKDDAPMPDGSENGVKTVDCASNEAFSFGEIRFTEPGTYEYTLSRVPGNNAMLSEDASVYTIKTTVGGEIETQYLKEGTAAEPVYADIQYSILTFDLGGGSLNGDEGPLQIRCRYGDDITLPEAPEKDGYEFDYWEGSRYEAGAVYHVEGDHAFTAVYKAVESDSPKTGDTVILIWVELFLMAALGLVVIARKRFLTR